VFYHRQAIDDGSVYPKHNFCSPNQLCRVRPKGGGAGGGGAGRGGAGHSPGIKMRAVT